MTTILSTVPHLDPILTPIIEAAGFSLVRLRLMGTKHKTLQIMAEKPDGTMDVEDCARLSHALSDFLDTEPDIIEGEYSLEVSSPGIDRPLTRLKDFARWSGHQAKLELSAPLDGRKRFKGTLLGLDGSDVVFDTGKERLNLPFASISDAKLILTDKLIEEDFKAREGAEPNQDAQAAHREH
ncbi:ribosome maturation factor RimP [Rhizomicrobium palustre]|uniref:Ribosome maturation factor RimP n=1 Tax=Rhizomicrobium palustre TaxID=189966 RepID=A0A846MYG0_9PROT|nr:ribosome maturation factor RimP [Rhizomicrobium palustre]NIK88245.1 ribosome maturation factor RimP [Rhizomicrobium palustre]